MDHFEYRDGRLWCEDAEVSGLAARFGTPLYVYSAATLRHHYARLRDAFAPLDPLICFSVKSCSNLHVLKLLVGMGAGLDVVSGGELARARLAGASPDKVVYAGVGKSDAEILSALGRPEEHEPAPLQTGPIGLFNVESEQEFQTIAGLAEGAGVKARAALRVNPDVDPVTHKYTTTGKAETKFGVDLTRAREFFRRYDGNPFLKLSGIHIHLGSPVSSVQPYVQAVEKIVALVDELEAAGHRIDTLNLGGGFGADYVTGQSLDAAAYAAAIVPRLAGWLEARWAKTGRKTRIVLEPGRTIAASAGVLLSRVEYVKTSGSKKFLVCDAGMHTLIRPALYEAFHFIWPANVAPMHEPTARVERPDMPALEACDVVGPICETGDFLAKDRPMPLVARGDLLAVFTAGAYGMSMASRYNSHPLPAEVLVDGASAKLIRRRESYADLVEHEVRVEE
ncbi:MAG: diaminopimelate decarboxylase [Phycisphaerales bacterium]|nr:diaminopimelate decarboxylase [Phycisphaerales bacterium]